MINLWIQKAWSESSYLPTQASTIASDVDAVYNFLLYSSALVFIILMGGMVFFIVKYKRKSDSDKTAYIEHNHFLEFIWSFIPLVVFVGVFWWGWKVWEKTRIIPEKPLEVKVFAFQWGWEIAYDNGKKSPNELVVPVNTKVALDMRSKDVIHSFYVPSFRIKQDIVPGRISKTWFEATKTGTYHMFCTEYCGTAHSKMIGTVKVVDKDEFEEWYNKTAENMSLAEMGEEIYKLRCVACHSVDGSKVVGPTFKGLWGSTRNFAGGGSAKADEDYIRESILNPNTKVVAGYGAGQMPVFQGQLSEEEVTHLVEFIKTIK